eukprot:scaffold9386_cov154-Ochromonas_danica.AAC.19
MEIVHEDEQSQQDDLSAIVVASALILEMYKLHQEDCANDIIPHELSICSFSSLCVGRLCCSEGKMTSSEEREILTCQLFRKILEDDRSLMKASNSFPSATSPGRCHIMSKNCLKWGGMNMGITLLQSLLPHESHWL